MFRRRAFVRAARRALMPDIPPLLQRANQLMAAGDYSGAAAAFEEMARGAVARNGPRAPIFLIQAGRARILTGQVPAGMAHIKQGLSLFAARGQWPELHRAGTRAVAELNQSGLTAEARQIEDYLKATLPPMPGGYLGPAAPAERRKPVLPTNCPGCGGPVRADEVEWVDDSTAACPYCGSAVRGE